MTLFSSHHVEKKSRHLLMNMIKVHWQIFPRTVFLTKDSNSKLFFQFAFRFHFWLFLLFQSFWCVPILKILKSYSTSFGPQVVLRLIFILLLILFVLFLMRCYNKSRNENDKHDFCSSERGFAMWSK